MTTLDVSVRTEDRRAVFTVNGEEIWFEGAGLVASGDAAFCLTLLPAMATRAEVVRIDAPVSPELLDNAPELMAAFRRFFGLQGRPRIEATRADGKGASAGRHLAAFTAGIDSFYTVLELQEQLDELLFIVGYDVDLGVHETSVTPRIQAAADELGLPLRVVRTNLRAWSSKRISYTAFHGAAIIAVGHMLAGEFDRLTLASSHYTVPLIAWGSHPEVDPLWSSPGLAVDQHGALVHRFDKVRRVGHHQAVRDTLRVCIPAAGDIYNCGRCEKCLRTMLALAATGDLPHVATLPPDVTARDVLRVPIRGGTKPAMARHNLARLTEAGAPRSLRFALAYRARVPGVRYYARRAKIAIRRAQARAANRHGS